MVSRKQVSVVGSVLVVGILSSWFLVRPNDSFSSPILAPSPTSTSSAPLDSAKNPLTHPQIFVQVADRLVPSVVNIFTTKSNRRPRGGMRGMPIDPWQFFGGGGGGPGVEPFGDSSFDHEPAQAFSLGSGVIIETSSGEGLILTNNHVIDGATEVKVKFTENDEEKESAAQVIGTDPDLDIALVRVKTNRPMKAAPLGDSDRLSVGEWVAAVGNPFGHGHSISHGIVSAKARTLPGGFGKYLQLDAPINPGNSGGPLVNLQGEIIGINNAIDARGPGIGFAIPINSVKAILASLKKKGSVERGFIGANIQPLTTDLARALRLEDSISAPIISDVVPGMPASRAGLRPYDVIVAIDGVPVHSPGELVASIANTPVGQKINAQVIRSGKKMDIILKVEKRPVLNRG